MRKVIPDRVLSLCSVPIGNLDDITLRVLQRLRKAEVIVCEEFKPARRLLKHHGLDFYEGEFIPGKGRYLCSLSDNSVAAERDYLKAVLQQCISLAYVSDCGSPMFEDPGHSILQLARGFYVEYLPGVTSLSALMMHLPQEIKQFRVEGFLPRKREQRIQALRALNDITEPVFLMETPYRMHKLLEELKEYSPHRRMIFGYRLSCPEETVIQGKVHEVCNRALQLEQNEFVLFLHH